MSDDSEILALLRDSQNAQTSHPGSSSTPAPSTSQAPSATTVSSKAAPRGSSSPVFSALCLEFPAAEPATVKEVVESMGGDQAAARAMLADIYAPPPPPPLGRERPGLFSDDTPSSTAATFGDGEEIAGDEKDLSGWFTSPGLSASVSTLPSQVSEEAILSLPEDVVAFLSSADGESLENLLDRYFSRLPQGGLQVSSDQSQEEVVTFLCELYPTLDPEGVKWAFKYFGHDTHETINFLSQTEVATAAVVNSNISSSSDAAVAGARPSSLFPGGSVGSGGGSRNGSDWQVTSTDASRGSFALRELADEEADALTARILQEEEDMRAREVGPDSHVGSVDDDEALAAALQKLYEDGSDSDSQNAGNGGGKRVFDGGASGNDDRLLMGAPAARTMPASRNGTAGQRRSDEKGSGGSKSKSMIRLIGKTSVVVREEKGNTNNAFASLSAEGVVADPSETRHAASLKKLCSRFPEVDASVLEVCLAEADGDPGLAIKNLTKATLISKLVAWPSAAPAAVTFKDKLSLPSSTPPPPPFQQQQQRSHWPSLPGSRSALSGGGGGGAPVRRPVPSAAVAATLRKELLSMFPDIPARQADALLHEHRWDMHATTLALLENDKVMLNWADVAMKDIKVPSLSASYLSQPYVKDKIPALDGLVSEFSGSFTVDEIMAEWRSSGGQWEAASRSLERKIMMKEKRAAAVPKETALPNRDPQSSSSAGLLGARTSGGGGRGKGANSAVAPGAVNLVPGMAGYVAPARASSPTEADSSEAFESSIDARYAGVIADKASKDSFHAFRSLATREHLIMSAYFLEANKLKAQRRFAEAEAAIAKGMEARARFKQAQLDGAFAISQHNNSGNASGSSGTGTNQRNEKEIDLHGLTVAEAIDALETKLSETRGKIHTLHVITGAGRHSGSSGPKILPAVMEFCNKYNLSFFFINPGKLGIINE